MNANGDFYEEKKLSRLYFFVSILFNLVENMQQKRVQNYVHQECTRKEIHYDNLHRVQLFLSPAPWHH